MSNISVSIIIPVYNRENFIQRAIYSVLEQNGGNSIEVIVINDGSSDNTEQKVLEINDNRIIYKSLRKNYGACFARNIGIKLAKGKYIAFQDSDDVWKIRKLERNLDIIKKTKADVVTSNYYFIQNNNKKVALNRLPGFVSFSNLLMRNYCSTQTFLGKSEIFKEILFDDNLPRLQDWDIILRIAQRYKVYYDNEPLVNVYLMNDSITSCPQKGIVSLNYILNKYDIYFKNNKNALSHQYIILSNLYGQINNSNKMLYSAYNAIKYHFDIKSAGNFIMSLIKIFYKMSYIFLCLLFV